LERASPDKGSNKRKKAFLGHEGNTPTKYAAKMSVLVEETEPESSFKETTKRKPQ
jgi:hypothetical protein